MELLLYILKYQPCPFNASKEASYIDASNSEANFSPLLPLIVSFHSSFCPGASLFRKDSKLISSFLLVKGTVMVSSNLYDLLFFTAIICIAKLPLCSSVIGISISFCSASKCIHSFDMITFLTSISYSTFTFLSLLPIKNEAFSPGSPVSLIILNHKTLFEAVFFSLAL